MGQGRKISLLSNELGLEPKGPVISWPDINTGCVTLWQQGSRVMMLPLLPVMYLSTEDIKIVRFHTDC